MAATTLDLSRLREEEFQDKKEVHILVVGHMGHGKSSLVNMICGGKVEELNQPSEYYNIKRVFFNGMDTYFYDCKGFGNPGLKENVLTVLGHDKMSFDVVLICHKLFNRVDSSTHDDFKLMIERFGDDLFERAILLFTFGDDYRIRSQPYRQGDPDEEVKRDMEGHRDNMRVACNEILKTSGVKEDVVNKIPALIVSGKERDLPSSINWVDEFWYLCHSKTQAGGPVSLKPLKRSGNLTKTVVAIGLMVTTVTLLVCYYKWDTIRRTPSYIGF
jgi:energy-coupling factor transporter ATP-binding protein EcfA2